MANYTNAHYILKSCHPSDVEKFYERALPMSRLYEIFSVMMERLECSNFKSTKPAPLSLISLIHQKKKNEKYFAFLNKTLNTR